MNTLHHTGSGRFVTTADAASDFEVHPAGLNCVASSRLSTLAPPWGRYWSVTDLGWLLAHPGVLPDEGLRGKDQRKRRILIVDDKPAVVTFIERALRLESIYELATACDGFEAEHQLTTFQPDLIVLDIMLPGVSGFEICRRVRTDPATQQVKILAVTGLATDENIEQILQHGADACLEKPLKLYDLREKVERLLESEG